MKRIYKLLFSLVLASGLCVWAAFRMKGFSEDSLYVSFPSQKPWKVRSEGSLLEIKDLLNQTFSYLGKGRQCLVFEGEDKQTVIKFINQSRFSLPSCLLQIPLPYSLEKKRRAKQEKKQSRISSFYESFKMGYEFLPEQTGCIYLHLYPENKFSKPLTIRDPIGYLRKIDLNQTHFLIQKKAELIYPYLQAKQKDPEKFWQGVRSFLQLILARIQKGFMDDDLNVDQNIGFLEGKAVLIDWGRIYYKPEVKKDPYPEIRRSIKFFQKWLQQYHPEKVPQFEQELKQHLPLL